MKIEMGESLIYSWLRHIKGCQLVQNNWKVSSSWNLQHEEVLLQLMEDTDSYFQERSGYEIFKKNSSLSQILHQGECDAIGVSIQGSTVKYYAVEIAYHREGLNYGSKDETIMKIIEKLARTAMCLYGFLDTAQAEIVFASPKIHNNIIGELSGHIGALNGILRKHGLNYTVSVTANSDFNENIMQPVLSLSNDVADTSELFLRSYQLVSMFDTRKQPKKITHSTETTVTEDVMINRKIYPELKVGELANMVLRAHLENGAADEKEIEFMQQSAYSKKTFGLKFPLLVRADSIFEKARYYVTSLSINDVEYKMCKEWYEKPSDNDRPYLEKWLSEHEIDLG